MKSYFIRLSNKHEIVFKFALILTTILLIVIALPKETQFNYSFKKGNTWAFENLMAPFDFAINKSEAELNEEKAEVMRSTQPFYRFDDHILERKLKSFSTELDEV